MQAKGANAEIAHRYAQTQGSTVLAGEFQRLVRHQPATFAEPNQLLQQQPRFRSQNCQKCKGFPGVLGAVAKPRHYIQ